MINKNRHLVNIFCSYAHKDQKVRDNLAKHLIRMDILVWYDRDINVGTNWVTEIDQHLESADIVLLLISADFMASKYCYEKEMMRALDRQKEDSIFVIPIIVRPTYYGSDVPFSYLQASPLSPYAPYPLKPVSTWGNQDEAFVAIAKDIDKDVRKVLKKKYMQEGNVAITNAQAQEGYQAYRQAFTYDQRDVALCEKLARLLVSLERPQEALDMYKKAIELQPENGDFFRRKGKLQSQFGMNKEASIAYQQAVKLGENDAELYEEMGDAFSVLGQFDEAAEAYKKATHLQPSNAQLYIKLGVTLNSLDKKQEALKAYEQAGLIKPDEPQIYIDRAEICIALGNHEGELTAYRSLISLKPHDLTFYVKLAVKLDKLARYEEAVEVYNDALHLDESNDRLWRDKGDILLNLGRYLEAYTAYQEAIRWAPPDRNPFYKASVYKNSADALCKLNYFEEAVLDYDKAIEHNPEHERWYLARAAAKKEIMAKVYRKYEEVKESMEEDIELAEAKKRAADVREIG